jgi:hypothetical protein
VGAAKPQEPGPFLSPAESRPRESLGRSPGLEGDGPRWIVGGFTFPGYRRVVLSKPHALAHSGGTAPALHRSSLLCPDGHPKAGGLYHRSEATCPTDRGTHLTRRSVTLQMRPPAGRATVASARIHWRRGAHGAALTATATERQENRGYRFGSKRARCATGYFPSPAVGFMVPWWMVGMLGGAVVIAVSPARGVPDRLVRTWVVPR